MKKNLLTVLLLIAPFAQSTANCGCGCVDYPTEPICGFIDNFYVGTKEHLVLHNKLTFTPGGVPTVAKYKPGIGGSLMVGANINCFAFEVEGAYRRSDLDKETVGGELSSRRGWIEDTSVMANAFFRWPFENCFEARIGAGAGVDFHRRQITDINDANPGTAVFDELIFKNSQRLFAWQLMTDLTYYIRKNVAVSLGYTFFTTEKLKINTGVKSSKNPHSHNINIGLLVKF